MRIVTIAIFLIWVAIASTPATELTGEQRAAAFVRAIQEATDQNDLDRKLKMIDPNLQDRSWVLPPLFASIASGHAKPETWTALCRVDRWGDGAWHLEMKAAAFDGFAKNPQAFVDRYLSGDDCSLLLLLYAYRWTLEAADVGAVDCAAKGQEQFA